MLSVQSPSNRFEERVLEKVKLCQERNESSLTWGMEVSKCVREAGLGLPSAELGEILVSYLCFDNNNPSLWKFIDQAISSGILSSLQLLALLTSRVVPHRRTQPEAYRLYLELLSRYAFSSIPTGDLCKKQIMKSVDDALHLSKTYNTQIFELGHALVLFLFSVITCLTDSTLEDWGLQQTSREKFSGMFGGGGHQDMDVDSTGNHADKRKEHREQLRVKNAFTAIDVLAKLTEHKKAMVLLRLIYLNMPENFNGLMQKLQFLEAKKLAGLNLKSASQLLERLSLNIQRVQSLDNHLNKRHLTGVLINIGSLSSASCSNFGTARAYCWVPFDLYMEMAMDGKQLPATSAIYIVTELIKTLQVINRASWQQTFQALWISALRLVQRERDPHEGPIPHLDARLCVLLSVTPLAIARVVDEEEASGFCNTLAGHENGMAEKTHAITRYALTSSLQALGQFSALLSPPASVVNAANNAAAKAAEFVSSFKNANDGFSGRGHGGAYSKAGTMLHLIVEACIARKLIDTSSYFWPGYVSGSVTPLSDSSLDQGSPWSTFMEGAPITGALRQALIATPASSFAEIEKLYHIALNGSEEEKTSAAKILCGASLSRGWNIQEHVVHFIVKLLSPPLPINFTGPGSHVVNYMSMLNAILFGISSIDIVHVLSLHGMVPEVAASLMPLCEAFGSLVPTTPGRKSTGVDEPTAYTVFSCAFLFLLRLWKFYRPPHEHCIKDGGGYAGPDLTLEYLLILRNSRIASHNSSVTDTTSNASNPVEKLSAQAVYIDSFPKLRAWYCQNKACIASTLAGLCSGNPVHQVANKILNMIYWKMTKSGSNNHSTLSGSSISGSPVSTGEDAYERPLLPAWEVLEATPFVLEAVLTACAHGKLSSRDLTTGLRDLVDFLPASLAAIISYFSAEITRGIWKPVAMNGTDWPSPAANLPFIESEIKGILASVGVTVPCSSAGVGPVMLPLPVAALVSLTITFKLDKNMEYIHGVAGPALENCAAGCPRPSMPIIGALWAQKVRRWHDFIVVSCSRSMFKQDQRAVAQLLRSCFTSFLGSPHGTTTPVNTEMGVNGLLGRMISGDGRPSVAPGFLYLRSARAIQNVHFVNDVIVEVVAESARASGSHCGQANTARLKSHQTSLASATARAKEVAMLGASLLCVSGGVQLVQVLYQATIPTWLLSTRKVGETGGPMSCILEGYSMAYLMILSGSFMWGIGETCPTRALTRQARTVRAHMNFVAGALEGNISLGCNPATWKAYVSCFVGLVVTFAPSWLVEVKPETLRKLANGLKGWHETELALSLLERGGAAAMGHVVDFLDTID